MKIGRWHGPWWTLPLGFVAGVLTWVLIAWLTPLDSHGVEQMSTSTQQAPLSCRQDPTMCPTSAQEFVDNFRAGAYGHIRRNHYSHAARRVILNMAERKWNRIHGMGVRTTTFDRAAMWQRFLRTDDCVDRTINNMVSACVPGQPLSDVVCHTASNTVPSDGIGVCNWPVAPQWWHTMVDRIVFCGLTLVPAFATTRLFWLGYGGGACYAAHFVP